MAVDDQSHVGDQHLVEERVEGGPILDLLSAQAAKAGAGRHGLHDLTASCQEPAPLGLIDPLGSAVGAPRRRRAPEELDANGEDLPVTNRGWRSKAICRT
jgi:hypothetical protein